MDARERLRRYLEQRRELGESEFVLDGMPVEDVLKLVGVKHTGQSAGRRGGGSGGNISARASARADAAPPHVADDGPPPYTVESASGHGAPPPYETEALHPVEPAPPPAPPAPDVRFDRRASTDWRETLRNAGAMVPPGKAGTPGGVPAKGAASGAGGASGGASAGELGGASAAPPVREPVPVHSAASGTVATLPDWLAALGVPAGLEAGAVKVGDLMPDVAALPSLEDVARHIAACQRCALYKTAKHPVPGEGHPHAEVLCVGEAPGANEDLQGRPFVGDAGQLLTKILAAIQLRREDVFIHNVLKHRPPGNRDPLPDEVHACQPYLLRQIELVQPRVILALGRFAAQTLLQTTTAIGSLRGKIHRFHGVPLVVTYHPAALLRNEAWKRPTWEDVKLARRILDASRAAEPTRSSE